MAVVLVVWFRQMCYLAEVGTLQLEFRYLSKKLGNPAYGQMVCVYGSRWLGVVSSAFVGMLLP